MSEKNLVRVNTRISIKTNDFLDRYSSETGMSKSSLISLACEQFKLQIEGMDVMSKLLDKMDLIEKKIDSDA